MHGKKDGPDADKECTTGEGMAMATNNQDRSRRLDIFAKKKNDLNEQKTMPSKREMNG